MRAARQAAILSLVYERMTEGMRQEQSAQREGSRLLGRLIRSLPTEPRDMVPSAVRWAQAVLGDVAGVPLTEVRHEGRASLRQVVWVLAAAADYHGAIPAELTARVLASEAGISVRLFQKWSTWLRRRGWLEHGPRGVQDGWQLRRSTGPF